MGDCKKLQSWGFVVCCFSTNVTIVTKLRWIRWPRLVASIRKRKIRTGFWEGSLEKLNHLGGLAVEDNIKI